MKSRITIEVDFDNGNLPVIQILQENSDDVRDKLLKSFTEQLNYLSSWCQIRWVSGFTSAVRDAPIGSRIHITPISPYQLKEQANIMLEQAKLIEEKYKKEGYDTNVFFQTGQLIFPEK